MNLYEMNPIYLVKSVAQSLKGNLIVTLASVLVLALTGLLIMSNGIAIPGKPAIAFLMVLGVQLLLYTVANLKVIEEEISLSNIAYVLSTRGKTLAVYSAVYALITVLCLSIATMGMDMAFPKVQTEVGAIVDANAKPNLFGLVLPVFAYGVILIQGVRWICAVPYILADSDTDAKSAITLSIKMTSGFAFTVLRKCITPFIVYVLPLIAAYVLIQRTALANVSLIGSSAGPLHYLAMAFVGLILFAYSLVVTSVATDATLGLVTFYQDRE